MTRGQAVTEPQAAAVARKLALALHEAHEKGIIHRDLKPGNIMVNRRRELIIMDFGLARVMDVDDSPITRTGNVLGTALYMAPEQAAGNIAAIGPASDVYSLGVILYELLTGVRPFEGPWSLVIGLKNVQDPDPPSKHRPDLSPALNAICLKAIARDPMDRYATMAEFAEALGTFLAVPASTAPASDAFLPIKSPESLAAQVFAGIITDEVASLQDQKPPTQPKPARSEGTPPRSRSRGKIIAAAGAAAVLLLGVIIYVVTDKGRIKIEVNDPDAVVHVDGKEVRIEGLGDPITLRTGEHELSVKRGNVEAEVRKFVVQRGENRALIIKLEPPQQRQASTSEPVPTDIAKVDPATTPSKPTDPPTPPKIVAENDPAVVSSEKVPELLAKQDPEMAPEPLAKQDPENPPVAKKIVSKKKAVGKAAERQDGWVSLFNGRDLTGWKTHPKQPGRNWGVVNGVLVGSGPTISHLYTERDDFTDFHLRIEARFNPGGGGGVFIRCPFGPRLPVEDPKWPEGYKATINDPRFRGLTGGLLRTSVGNDADFFQSPKVPPRVWFTMDVIADGEKTSVLVDGKLRAYHVGKPPFSRGHLALQQYSPESIVEYGKIEIKELIKPLQKDPREIALLDRASRVGRSEFSPDGLRILAFGSAYWRVSHPGGGFHHAGGYFVRAWEVANGRKVFDSGEHPGARSMAIASSSDGKLAASTAGKSAILIWDLEKSKNIHILTKKIDADKIDCDRIWFSPDNRRVFAAMRDGVVLSWDLATEQEQPSIPLKAGPVKDDEFPCAVFSPDGNRLVTGRNTGAVEIWELESGKRLRTLAGHAAEVRGVACSSDGRLILSLGTDNTVRLWDVAAGKGLKELRGQERHVLCIALSPDGRRALTAGIDGPVRLWDLATDKEVCSMEGHTMPVNSVAFSPDGHRAVSGSDDRTVRLWQLPE